MSLTLTLIPVAVAVGMSLGSSSVAALTHLRGKGGMDLEPVETAFQDGTLLCKTLNEHGLNVEQISENEYVIQCEAGTLHYCRAGAGLPFSLEVKGVRDMDELLSSLDSLENEYRRNVQAFTYDKVMSSLAEHGMTVDNEEVLEDDSILLTLRV